MNWSIHWLINHVIIYLLINQFQSIIYCIVSSSANDLFSSSSVVSLQRICKNFIHNFHSVSLMPDSRHWTTYFIILTTECKIYIILHFQSTSSSHIIKARWIQKLLHNTVPKNRQHIQFHLLKLGNLFRETLVDWATSSY